MHALAFVSHLLKWYKLCSSNYEHGNTYQQCWPLFKFDEHDYDLCFQPLLWLCILFIGFAAHCPLVDTFQSEEWLCRTRVDSAQVILLGKLGYPHETGLQNPAAM